MEECTKSNTPPWMFFTFFKLHKWYQIAQNITYIFKCYSDSDIISGNLTDTISDHLSQFAIVPNVFGNILSNKSTIY